jgi:hypothetical protein
MSSEVQPDEAGAQPLSTVAPSKSRRALSGLKRELTDDELASTGAQKLLLDLLEQSQEENENLKSFRDRFYASDKQLGVLQEKLKTKIGFEVLSTAAIAVGGASLGFSRSVWSDPSGYGWMLLVFGVLMTVAGIIAKVIRS